MKQSIRLRRELEAEARRHQIKLLGCGTLNRHKFDGHQRLICEAAIKLARLQPGEVLSFETGRPDVFIVARSYETLPPVRCACCDRSQPPTVTPATVTDSHLILADDLRHLPLRKPSPVGWT